jgi:uncharacterized protein
VRVSPAWAEVDGRTIFTCVKEVHSNHMSANTNEELRGTRLLFFLWVGVIMKRRMVLVLVPLMILCVTFSAFGADALQELRQKAGQGDAKAQSYLGDMYYLGKGVQKDHVEAEKWYRMAAEQGNANAQFNLGVMYSIGKGVPQNDSEAFKWFRMAAEQGDPEAQLRVWNSYSLGKGVQKDNTEAAKWIRKAADQGNAKAQSILGALYDSTKPEEPASRGSGFFINGKGDLITNHHVVDGCSSLRVWSSGKPITASLLKSDERNDLALLNAKAANSVKGVIFRSAGSIGLGEPAVVAGYPLRGLLTDSLNVSSGNVSSLAGPKNDSRLLQITTPAQPGYSGGPVFDQNGLVIGVVVAKPDAVSVAGATGDIPQNVNFAINGAVLRSFLEVNDTEFWSEAPGQMLKAEELAAQARLSAVSVECLK